MPTKPTSILNRIMGVEAFTDALSLPAGTTLGGKTVDDTGSLLAIGAAATTLTVTQALHSGKVLLIASTGGLAITPPPATGTGAVYRLFVAATVSGGNVTWDAKAGNASDVFYGWVETWHASAFAPYVTASNSNLITLNGTTTGGVKGDFIELRDMATNVWLVSGFLNQTGSVATPFSNH